jgi:hypothetical protein
LTSSLQYQEPDTVRFLLYTEPILTAEIPVITTASVFSIIKIRFTSIEALVLSRGWLHEIHRRIFFLTNVLEYQDSDIVRFLLPTQTIPTADFPVTLTAGIYTVINTD